eukprot:scaffold4844_cov112-Cylindrotheca_fusiformis.AAC.1
MPNPTAAKKAISTRETPTRVTKTRDSKGSRSKRKRIEKKAMIRIDAASKVPLLRVIFSKSLPAVPLTEASEYAAQ